MIQPLNNYPLNEDINKIIQVVNQLIEAENKRLERGVKMQAGKKAKAPK